MNVSTSIQNVFEYERNAMWVYLRTYFRTQVFMPTDRLNELAGILNELEGAAGDIGYNVRVSINRALKEMQ